MKQSRLAAARARLLELQRRGRLTPSIVLKDARDKKSPLHSWFEWSDSKAAEAYRLQQARYLIKLVKVEVQYGTERIVVPAMVRDPAKPWKEQGYRDVTSLRSDEDLARESVLRVATIAETWLRKTRDQAVVLGLQGDVDEILTRFTAFVRQLERAAKRAA